MKHLAECLTHSSCSERIAAAAADAKSLQSCPTLCDPRDGSPPGSPIPGILQARTLEWAAISLLSSEALGVLAPADKWQSSDTIQAFGITVAPSSKGLSLVAQIVKNLPAMQGTWV